MALKALRAINKSSTAALQLDNVPNELLQGPDVDLQKWTMVIKDEALETLSKQFKCELVISKYVALKANMKTDDLLTKKVKIRGRKDSLEIFTFNKGTEIIM